MGVVIVTGTGTRVGKTVTAAALAICAVGDVAVVKLAQTGCAPDARGDAAEIAKLARLEQVQEFARYPEPVAAAARGDARRCGRPRPRRRRASHH